MSSLKNVLFPTKSFLERFRFECLRDPDRGKTFVIPAQAGIQDLTDESDACPAFAEAGSARATEH
jgi:hypothetical protein